MSDINNIDDRIEIELPFSGFYESWHDERITEAVESEFRYDREAGTDREPTEVEADAIFMADVDWSATRIEYSREYANRFADEFDLDGLEYSGISSPAYYNFSTDRVFATIDRKEFNRKIREVVEQYDEWPEYIRGRFTSRDGFWSNYSNNSSDEEWTAEDLDACQYRVLLQCYIDHLATDDSNNNAEWSEREYYLCEDIEVYGFESVHNATETILKYIKDNPKVEE